MVVKSNEHHRRNVRTVASVTINYDVRFELVFFFLCTGVIGTRLIMVEHTYHNLSATTIISDMRVYCDINARTLFYCGQ